MQPYLKRLTEENFNFINLRRIIWMNLRRRKFCLNSFLEEERTVKPRNEYIGEQVQVAKKGR
jgi:hypothetical protein